MSFSIVSAAIAMLLSVQVIAPMEGTVTRRYEQPACQFCAGHRGVTIATKDGSDVVALLVGVVTFAGEVGGLTYVVLRIAPDVRVTYGWLASVRPEVNEGYTITQGAVIGTTGSSTYLGVRVGETYVDPLRFLGLGHARLRGPGRVVVEDSGFAR